MIQFPFISNLINFDWLLFVFVCLFWQRNLAGVNSKKLALQTPHPQQGHWQNSHLPVAHLCSSRFYKGSRVLSGSQ